MKAKTFRRLNDPAMGLINILKQKVLKINNSQLPRVLKLQLLRRWRSVGKTATRLWTEVCCHQPNAEGDPVWSAIKGETLMRWTVCKQGKQSLKWKPSALPWGKRKTSFYRESACPGPWLVHFYANEESDFCTVWLIHIALFWLVRIKCPDWPLPSCSDW